MYKRQGSRKILHQILLYAGSAAGRAAAAVRCGEGLVQVEEAHIKACVSGSCNAQKTVEMCIRDREKITAMVVVFIPPAVDPGEPPMSIKTIMSIWPASVIFVRSAVLKPAVLCLSLIHI